MWGSHWTMAMEKRGIPGVFIVDEPFKADVQITCEKEGMSALRRIVVPHPCGDVDDSQLPGFLDQLVDALTLPLTAEERHPVPKKAESAQRLAFRGTLDEIDLFFNRRGWSDGLPLMPPTEPAVMAMLTGTTHSPDEVVSDNMYPESLTVTVEKVATVGVMAGCKPEYMPVLLAIIEAMNAEWYSSTVRSTSSFSMAILVNGPIAAKIGMNAGINALGSGTGNKANATIGRFLRLALICLGGARTGVSDLSSIGNPSKYSFAFAENEKASPWEPYHVSAGYSVDDSVVTLMTGGWSCVAPFAQMQDDIDRALDSMSRAIARFELPNGALFVMDPMVARKLAAAGHTKSAVEERLWAKATKTAAEFRQDHFYTPFILPVLKGKSWYGKTAQWPASYLDVPPEQEIPIFPKGAVRIVVVGGATNPFTQAWQLGRPSSVVVAKWV
jgi:hypothetical protein